MHMLWSKELRSSSNKTWNKDDCWRKHLRCDSTPAPARMTKQHVLCALSTFELYVFVSGSSFGWLLQICTYLYLYYSSIIFIFGASKISK